jgi:excisionase family DNA binding protein
MTVTRRAQAFIDRQPRYLRTAEVAEILQVAPKTVHRWAKEGKLNATLRTLGGHRRYDEAEVRALLETLIYVPTREEATR